MSVSHVRRLVLAAIICRAFYIHCLGSWRRKLCTLGAFMLSPISSTGLTFLVRSNLGLRASLLEHKCWRRIWQFWGRGQEPHPDGVPSEGSSKEWADSGAGKGGSCPTSGFRGTPCRARLSHAACCPRQARRKLHSISILRTTAILCTFRLASASGIRLKQSLVLEWPSTGVGSSDLFLDLNIPVFRSYIVSS